MKYSEFVIGIDLDNTIIRYDDLFCALAGERGLIPPGRSVDKNAVRNHVRTLPGGEVAWQRLQAAAYGPMIRGARPMAGVVSFMDTCFRRGAGVHVVSHKTEFARRDETGTNLREAARRWLDDNGFFSRGLCRENVWFESTRADKARRIKRLGCTHFIDDLVETFLEPGFPAATRKYLLGRGNGKQGTGLCACGSWKEVLGELFPGE